MACRQMRRGHHIANAQRGCRRTHSARTLQRRGVALQGASPDADAMHTALEAALSPDMQSRARSVAASMTRDGATIAAQFLIELAQTP